MAQINFNNNNEQTAATSSVGISIYDQRYKTEDTFTEGLATSALLTILNKVIKVNEGYSMAGKEFTTSDVFNDLAYTGGNNENTKKMDKNQVLAFQCIKRIGEVSYYTYYCYFKDSSDNAWLIYVTNEKTLPVVFDIQDSLEPIFSGVSGDSGFKVTMVNTGNFILQRNSNNEFAYDNIQLKNTSFNLGIDEKTESSVAMKPFAIYTISTN